MKNNNLPSSLTSLQGAKIYAMLSKDITSAGVLDRSYKYYTLMSIFALAGFFISVYLLFISNAPLVLLLLCTALAFFTVQIGGLMHDTAHRAVFKSTRNNDVLGQAVTAFICMGYSSWKARHNEHHANPNEIGKDDDIIDYPFISFSKDRVMKANGLNRFLMRYQIFTYYPMLLLISLELRIYPLLFFLKKREVKYLPEIFLYFLGLFAWFILPFLVIPIGKALLIVISVNILIGFYTGNIFAPNHKGMPLNQKGIRKSFFELQVVTTRNIKPGLLTDFFYMGLNYQIEHHLFPHCPRHKLGLITPYVKKACRENNLEFTETSVAKSQKIILSELARVASFA